MHKVVVDAPHAGKFLRGTQHAVAKLQFRQHFGLCAHIFHGAFVIQDLPVRRAHQMGVFIDPDTFARLVPVNLRDKPANLVVTLKHFPEQLAPPGLDVPLQSNVPDCGKHFRFRCITIELYQRGIGTQLPACWRGSVGTDRQKFKQG